MAYQIGNNRIKRKDVTPIAFLKGEEVFLRSDFEDLKTSSGWLKVNRCVIENAKPIATRTVYNRDKRMHVQTSLFSESQTVLVAPKQMCDGQIPTSDYDNVDATGEVNACDICIFMICFHPILQTFVVEIHSPRDDLREI